MGRGGVGWLTSSASACMFGVCMYLAPYGLISGRMSSAAKNSTFLPFGLRAVWLRWGWVTEVGWAGQ